MPKTRQSFYSYTLGQHYDFAYCNEKEMKKLLHVKRITWDRHLGSYTVDYAKPMSLNCLRTSNSEEVAAYFAVYFNIQWGDTLPKRVVKLCDIQKIGWDNLYLLANLLWVDSIADVAASVGAKTHILNKFFRSYTYNGKEISVELLKKIRSDDVANIILKKDLVAENQFEPESSLIVPSDVQPIENLEDLREDVNASVMSDTEGEEETKKIKRVR